ncbi:hypothetical protein QCA50_001243 [Cerrena zonata]|uniref:Uncharacterized protein n=1 Tax=Cerrena zonata TaxID=2478898 RepID=A0AAW0GTK5_9APHY
MPPDAKPANRRSSHSRSHSRNHSMSISSLSTSASAPMTFTTPAKLESPPPSPLRSSMSSSKRNSHHRRRSSVSTRHESAEMMGVSLPPTPVSSSDDNINLGDKDSIRRRALWALEGKPDVGSFSKVNIPELTSPDTTQRPFEFPSKPSFPPGSGFSSGGLSSLMTGKRNSYGKFMSSASGMEELGTLVEEEEEEEDSNVTMTTSPIEEVAEPAIVASTPSPARPRPASLNLKPLALASSHTVSYGDLPTPSPSPNVRPGLRSLTLAPTPDVKEDAAKVGNLSRKRHSMMVLSSAPSSAPVARRPSLNILPEMPAPVPTSAPAKRSSISYHPSSDSGFANNFGLPTPEMTPISEKHYSSSSVDSEISRSSSRGSRPLSITEQHFLFQAHQTLVQRISDLERALAARPRSRPQSYASDVSCEPSDEMLHLIADLKSERDELKKDVDGWRTRLADTEKQLSMMMRRVENERRDAWVARERVGLLEVEKKSLQKALQEKSDWAHEGWNKYHDASAELSAAREECDSFRAQAHRIAELEAQQAATEDLLKAERSKREELEKELEGLLATPTPRMFEGVSSQMASVPLSRGMFVRRGGLGFRSIDSVGSFTDVESVDGSDQPNFKLNAVQEEDETDTMTECSDEDELARYEEEDENDAYVFHSVSPTSSLGSIEDLQTIRREIRVPPLTSSSRSDITTPSPIPSPEPGHTRRNSLSKSWTFPVTANAPAIERELDEIDRFFGCLEDVDNSPPLGKFSTAESGKNLFSQALNDSDDDFPPFVIPADVGVEIGSPQQFVVRKPTLEVVQEEEEEDVEFEEEQIKEVEAVVEECDVSDSYNPADEDFNGQEVEGGIIFTFSPPPPFDESHDDSFDSSRSSDIQPVTPSPRTSYSSLPRPTSAKRFSLSPVTTPSKPTISVFTGFTPSSFSTPPSKRSTPSFTTSVAGLGNTPPSPSVHAKGKPASFIPQPRRASPVNSRIPVPSIRSPSPLTKASTSSMIPSMRSPIRRK